MNGSLRKSGTPARAQPVTLSGPHVTGSLPIWSPDGTKLFGFESGAGGSMRINGPHQGHDAMIVKPTALANILLDLAR